MHLVTNWTTIPPPVRMHIHRIGGFFMGRVADFYREKKRTSPPAARIVLFFMAIGALALVNKRNTKDISGRGYIPLADIFRADSLTVPAFSRT